MLFKQFTFAPLDAESVFFGGDYWLTLFAQHKAPPKQSKRQAPNQNFSMSVSKLNPLWLKFCLLLSSKAKIPVYAKNVFGGSDASTGLTTVMGAR